MSKNRRIVITGCGRGLGRSLVNEFVAAGHTVFGCSQSESSIAALQRDIAAPHVFTRVDICNDAAVADWAAASCRSGAPDLLINNAGVINEPADLWRVPTDEFERIVGTNITAVHSVIRHFVPVMIDAFNQQDDEHRAAGRARVAARATAPAGAKAAARFAVIVNLSSGWGRSVSAGVAPYCASKWAIEGLSKALAEELPDGMASIPLSPGVVDTDMLRRCWGEDAGSFPSPEHWAKAAAPYILSLDASDNGQSRTTPGNN